MSHSLFREALQLLDQPLLVFSRTCKELVDENDSFALGKDGLLRYIIGHPGISLLAILR
jgi:hypothetical protein